jgi:hypothetical protein
MCKNVGRVVREDSRGQTPTSREEIRANEKYSTEV